VPRIVAPNNVSSDREIPQISNPKYSLLVDALCIRRHIGWSRNKYIDMIFSDSFTQQLNVEILAGIADDIVKTSSDLSL
jgi:hypothetical protein